MYTETDLQLVSRSIDIYTKKPPETTSRNPQRGHFACTNCNFPPLSPTKRYSTAIVYAFSRTAMPLFAFLFSRNDTAYYDDTLSKYLLDLMSTESGHWIYWPKENIDSIRLHVRGWWDIENNQTFQHNNGWINLEDHISFDNEEIDENHPPTAEFGLKTYTPNINGVYRKWNNLSTLKEWDDSITYENTFVHQSSDNATKMPLNEWTKYINKKAPKNPKKLPTRQQRQTLTNTTAEIEERIFTRTTNRLRE